MKSVLTRHQKKLSEWRTIDENLRMQVETRYDDKCGNGHNTFAITTTIKKRYREFAGGCLHDEIREHFPEYSHLIKWHLMSSDGPMSYVANTLYHAGNKNCWGKAKGEPMHYKLSIKFKNFPIIFRNIDQGFLTWLKDLNEGYIGQLEVIGLDHDDRKTYGTHYTFNGFGNKWHECPFRNECEALEFLETIQTHDYQIIETPTSFSKGKDRDLDAARSCAIWPDASDEKLISDNLEERLKARLPALITAFKIDIERLGFTF